MKLGSVGLWVKGTAVLVDGVWAPFVMMYFHPLKKAGFRAFLAGQGWVHLVCIAPLIGCSLQLP